MKSLWICSILFAITARTSRIACWKSVSPSSSPPTIQLAPPMEPDWSITKITCCECTGTP